MHQVAWLEDGEVPGDLSRWTSRDDLLYRAQYYMWLATHTRSTISPSARAVAALGVVAWLVPATVLEQRALPVSYTHLRAHETSAHL
eukprot:12583303-Alexandrium_andersonii.AAC.1